MKILWIFSFPSRTLCLAKFLFWSYGTKCSWPIRLQDSLNCNISRYNWWIKLIFDVQIKIRVSHKLLLLLTLFFDICIHVDNTYAYRYTRARALTHTHLTTKNILSSPSSPFPLPVDILIPVIRKFNIRWWLHLTPFLFVFVKLWPECCVIHKLGPVNSFVLFSIPSCNRAELGT